MTGLSNRNNAMNHGLPGFLLPEEWRPEQVYQLHKRRRAGRATGPSS